MKRVNVITQNKKEPDVKRMMTQLSCNQSNTLSSEAYKASYTLIAYQEQTKMGEVCALASDYSFINPHQPTATVGPGPIDSWMRRRQAKAVTAVKIKGP